MDELEKELAALSITELEEPNVLKTPVTQTTVQPNAGPLKVKKHSATAQGKVT